MQVHPSTCEKPYSLHNTLNTLKLGIYSKFLYQSKMHFSISWRKTALWRQKTAGFQTKHDQKNWPNLALHRRELAISNPAGGGR
jgi:hypothetical protein